MHVDLFRISDSRISPHFSLAELCDDVNYRYGFIDLGLDFLEFIKCLEEFRVWYNRPIFVNSCYRTRSTNEKVGGSSNSSHLKGLAVDFNYPPEYKLFDSNRKWEFLNNVRKKWIEICRRHNRYYQVNWYSSYFHLGFGLNKDNFMDKR